jgi:hypothetical protein
MAIESPRSPSEGNVRQLGREFAHYIAAFMDGERLDEPDFDALTSPLELGYFLASLSQRRIAALPLG